MGVFTPDETGARDARLGCARLELSRSQLCGRRSIIGNVCGRRRNRDLVVALQAPASTETWRTWPMNRLASAFAKGRPALVCFITAGDGDTANLDALGVEL